MVKQLGKRQYNSVGSITQWDIFAHDWNYSFVWAKYVICEMDTYNNTTENMRAIGYISHWKGLVETNLIKENLIL